MCTAIGDPSCQLSRDRATSCSNPESYTIDEGSNVDRAMNSPPTNPFSHSSSLVGRDNDDGNEFYINDNVGTSLSSLPSFNGLPPPSSSLRGAIGTTADNSHGEQTTLGEGGSSFTSWVSRIMNNNCCSIQSLQPFFQIDTIDIIVRVKSTMKYIMINDGFRNNVLYSDIAAVSDLALSISSSNDNNNSSSDGALASVEDTNDTDSSINVNNPLSGGGFGGSDDEIESYDRARTATSSVSVPSIRLGRMVGKGPDLYGPIWITFTLVFCAAVTSNMSLYLHHSKSHRLFAKSMIDGGGVAAEEEWDYDLNKLLHAMWILYGYSFGLPTVVYCAMGMIGNNSSNTIRFVELICLYGYSLVPYLPVMWVCIIPINWIQWTTLFLATIISGMFVLRNVISSIMRNSGHNIRYGSSSSGGVSSSLQRSSGGGLIMCLVACHFVFFLILKLMFYHHVGLPKK